MLKLSLRSLFILLFMTAVLAGTSFAGDDFGSPEEKATEWATWLNNKVGLSSDQYTQAHGIYLKYAQQYKADREKKSGKHKGGFKSYRKKANEEVKSILTQDQLSKWKGKKKKS